MLTLWSSFAVWIPSCCPSIRWDNSPTTWGQRVLEKKICRLEALTQASRETDLVQSNDGSPKLAQIGCNSLDEQQKHMQPKTCSTASAIWFHLWLVCACSCAHLKLTFEALDRRIIALIVSPQKKCKVQLRDSGNSLHSAPMVVLDTDSRDLNFRMICLKLPKSSLADGWEALQHVVRQRTK